MSIPVACWPARWRVRRGGGLLARALTSPRWRRCCRVIGEAQRFNAGAMELGQTVCTARSRAAIAAPLAQLCAWRAAGYPSMRAAPPPPHFKRRAAGALRGQRRQVRGLIMRELRQSDTQCRRGRRVALARRRAARARPGEPARRRSRLGDPHAGTNYPLSASRATVEGPLKGGAEHSPFGGCASPRSLVVSRA